jgi:hypothetical protein
MLEIDGVRSAIERAGDFERADRASDIYFLVIDRATRPQLSPRDIETVRYGRLALDADSDFVHQVLTRNDDLFRQIGGGSVTEAYQNTLSQVDEMIKWRDAE